MARENTERRTTGRTASSQGAMVGMKSEKTTQRGSRTQPPRPEPAKPRGTRKLSDAAQQARAERAERNRLELLEAAARVVGDCGYRDASVQRITAAAGLAQGTFYLYFASRQALFDELLPHYGVQMLEYVRERVAPIKGFIDAEVTGLKVVFEYLSDNPWFWRVLNEAEVEAPTAWQRHHEEVTQRYLRFLRREKASGNLQRYSASELPTIAQFLVAARDYMYRSHLTTHAPGKEIPKGILETYRKFIVHGLTT
jgi:AcrR family transcriptional regulator